MTDKKFTDEEIKSSLEVIATTGNCNECKIRNCKWGTCNCSQITANAALDLINSQKEEIERLKSQCENTQIGYNFLKSDFERLKGSTIVNNIMEIQRIKRDAKAEAYKEFAEIIKDKWFDNRYDSPNVDFDDFIDDALKELVGEGR